MQIQQHGISPRNSAIGLQLIGRNFSSESNLSLSFLHPPCDLCDLVAVTARTKQGSIRPGRRFAEDRISDYTLLELTMQYIVCMNYSESWR